MKEPCDVCGEPSTNMARDLTLLAYIDDIQYEPIMEKKIKFGCDDHPAESITEKVHSMSQRPEVRCYT